MFVATDICRDKGFVATKIFCGDKHNFVPTKLLSPQAYFVATKEVFCCDKNVLVAATANDT